MKIASAGTITAAIAQQSMAHPHEVAMTFVLPHGATEELTFEQLHADALKSAVRLRAEGIRSGHRVIVAGQHDARLITLFVALLYAGATPAIAPYPTSFSQPLLYQQHLINMVKACQAHSVLVLPTVKEELEEQLASVGCLVLDLQTSADGVRETGADVGMPPLSLASDPAYLQFSSGTTGDLKGAIVSHAAAMRHLEMLVSTLTLNMEDVLVGWAPFFHDLGLVVYLLLPLISGVPMVTIPPDFWVRRPHSLLMALDHYRGTICMMPNFGFAHITRHARQRDIEGLDLSSVRILLSGAEVVQAETLKAFARRFQALGLSTGALCVGYGMTECVFMGTVTPPNRPLRVDRIERQALLNNRVAIPSRDTNAFAVTSCGFAMPGTRVFILDESSESLPERRVGEVVIVSPALFSSYQHRPELTRMALKQGQLFTGDLGYMADGELFIVDRKKDLIISAGKHIYPEALEQLALCIIGKDSGRVAAFGVPSEGMGTELPVLVCEVRRRLTAEETIQLAQAIRRHIYRTTDIALADIRLVRRGWLKTTTSGKIARSANREKYLLEM